MFLFAMAGVVCAQPSIDSGQVLNTSGRQAKLAPGAVWLIFGKNLGPDALTVASSPDFPMSVGGTSVTFAPASGGPAIQAKVWYSIANQVGGFLPSSAAPGTYNVTVTYNRQTSAPQSVTVVPRSMGIATSNGIGNGPAQATVANVNGGLSLIRNTSGSFDYLGYHWLSGPAHPGDELVLWGSGGGADLSNDPGAAPGSAGDQTAAGNFTVTVGTRVLTPDFAGSVYGSPGLWQINVRLPADIALDCFAPVQVSAGGELSNLTSIAIAAAGAANCSDSQFPLSVLTALDAGKNIINGAFGVSKIAGSPESAYQETASGFFGQYTATEIVLPRIGPKFNGCEIYDRTIPTGGKDPSSPDAFLDAGPRLPLSGVNVAAGAALNANATATGPSYSFSVPGGTLTGGNYTLSGSGGAAIGAFGVTTTFPSSFQGTNWDAIALVDRSQPLTFTWSGTGFDQVYIQVNSITALTGARRIVTMNCLVPAAPGTYSIPPAALAYMPPVQASGSSFGSIALEAHVPGGAFTAPLVGGGQTDLAVFGANLGFTKNVAIQ